MRTSLLSLLLLGACATQAPSPSTPPTSSTARIAWTFSVDGAPATCAELGTDDVTVTIQGPGYPQICAGDDPSDPFDVDYCYSPAFSVACSDGGLDQTFDAGSYQIGVGVELGGRVVTAGGTYGIDSDTAPPAIALDLASIDLSWDLPPGAEQYAQIEIAYSGGMWTLPFSPRGTTRLLVQPGSELLHVYLIQGPQHATRTVYESRIVVPKTGTSIAATGDQAPALAPQPR